MLRVIAAIILLAGSAASAAADTMTMDVRKTATCGCCNAWLDHLKQSGFVVRPTNVAMGILSKFKADHGIKPKHSSCHTGRIAGYTIEGHVPAREIQRLLKEKPDAIGLTVPGMPAGSPGMEMGSTARDAYDVLLIKKDGTTEVFASYSERR